MEPREHHPRFHHDESPGEHKSDHKKEHKKPEKAAKGEKVEKPSKGEKKEKKSKVGKSVATFVAAAPAGVHIVMRKYVGCMDS